VRAGLRALGAHPWDHGVGGRQGDDVTTTGGPEHSVAEPATVEQLDGDDIVVVPGAPPAHHRRSRAWLVGAVVVAVIAAGVGIAFAVTRDDGSSTVQSSAPVTPKSTPTPSPANRTPVRHRPVVRKPHVSTAPHTPVSSPPAVVVPPPPPVAQTEPPPTVPPVSPTSVLQWSATPAALTVPAGAHATLEVHVVNPSDGTVTLGHPLSCPPTLRGPKGHVIGNAVCTEMAQLLAPHQQMTQRYVITAASDGVALAPGIYTANVENLFDVKVTVTT
jgi:hypothetical protein